MSLLKIDAFKVIVDPLKLSVVSFPEFIAIFGGALSKRRANSSPKSWRDAFVRWTHEQEPALLDVLLIPENYDDWNDFDSYSDLLLFEQDLGYLTTAVLIFLESPGAIAELGAFSQIDSLRDRLIVVVSEEYHPQKSFISLGPIRNIVNTRSNANSLCVVPKIKKIDFHLHISIVMDALRAKRGLATSATETFKAGNKQHEILLVLDIVNLFIAPLFNEIKDIVSYFLPSLDMPRLRQILFLLEKSKLIIRKYYGRRDYYIANRFRKIYVDYTSAKTVQSFNRERMKAEIWGEVQRDRDRKTAYELASGGDI